VTVREETIPDMNAYLEVTTINREKVGGGRPQSSA